MVYRAEAVLPPELQYGFPSVWAYQSYVAEEARKDAIDSLKKSTDIAVTWSAGYQHALRWFHACMIHPQAF
jgi:hypothetical protein